jgi:5-methylcytosine-specific restriction endonuclease McrA
MHTCPTCGDTFDSRRGLGVHHSAAHGELLPNRTCSHCGERFHCEHEKKYCSDDCRDEAVSFEGEDNPNYRGRKSTTTCDICGDEFEYYPSEKEGLYCSTCVEEEDWRNTVVLEGEDNPRWGGGKRQLDCAVCKATVERYPSNVNEVTVCGEKCRTEWLSEEFTESVHPNWKGGGNGSYGKGWNAVRRRALERDGYECVVCSKSEEEIGRNPDVHHILPVRQFVASDDHGKADAHYLDNVVSLCVDCHRKADFGKISKTELRSHAGIETRTELPPSERSSDASVTG